MSDAEASALPADRPFDHAAEGRTSSGRPRVIGLDVTRAIALIGVVVMNYHGYLNGAGNPFDPSWAERLFHPWEGVLSTRFAATFVLVAGMGVTLLTDRSRLSGDAAAITHDRWRLVRRGVALYVGGWFLNHHWPGTILFFYGGYFVVAAALFTLRTRWIVLVGAASALLAAAISQWSIVRALDGHDTGWLDPELDTPRGLLLGTFVGGTHPLLPWLAYLCAGMVIGRHLGRLREIRPRLLAAGVAATAVSYAVNALSPSPSLLGDADELRSDTLVSHLLSTRPFDRGVLYTVGTLGTAIAAFCLISWLCGRWPTASPIVLLRRAGQMTLTLYVLHVLTFKVFVEWTGAVGATGLDTALVLALCFWVFAIAFGAWWQRLFGTGPVERLYRWLGG